MHSDASEPTHPPAPLSGMPAHPFSIALSDHSGHPAAQ